MNVSFGRARQGRKLVKAGSATGGVGAGVGGRRRRRRGGRGER